MAFRKQIRIFCLVGPAFFLLAAAGAPGGEDRESAAAALDQAFAAQDMQRDMPTKTALTRSRNGGGEGFSISAETAEIILWLAVGVFLLALLLTLRDSFRAAPGPSGGNAAAGGRDSDENVGVRIAAARDEADRLAALGRYAEAMHALLLQGLDEMRRRLDTPIASSLTSREIHARVLMPAGAEAAFADIMTRVEVSHFGGRDAGPDDYDRCRASYVALGGALAGGGAP